MYVISIDAKNENNSYEVFTNGEKGTGTHPSDWAAQVAELGAGEILLNSIDRDGSGLGYDIDLIQSVTKIVDIPVIACGGIGNYNQLASGTIDGNASAVAAGNIFHFYELLP